MASGEAPDSPLLRAAYRRLGLEPGVAPEAAWSAVLRRLRDDDFLPDPATHEAVLVLAGRPVGDAPFLAGELAEDEERLREEVDSFAEGFFAVPVGERRERWKSLMRACDGRVALQDRLRDLTPGLDVSGGSIVDRSPTVVRLAEDLLTLFVLRPGPRAALSRELARRFRSDPALTDRERARARRDLLRRHPDIAALSRGYLEQLARPRHWLWAGPRARVAVWLEVLGIFVALQLLGAVILSVFFFGVAGLTRVYQTTGPSPPPQSAPSVWDSRPPISEIPTKSPPSPEVAREFREDFKAALRNELAKLGKVLGEAELQKVVDALPGGGELYSGRLGAIVLFGQWTRRDHDRCVAALKEGLSRSGVALTREQIDSVARNCVPPGGMTPVPTPHGNDPPTQSTNGPRQAAP
jgi:hypothetical protein